ncbi:AI-2E family transporter [Caulobacter sp. DWR2-3-1b2]|uniref:AI-2E family transporter n=1 Tax=unclassified Caulobacter TaxID=2648921 RepID=UPI003CF7F71A
MTDSAPNPPSVNLLGHVTALKVAAVITATILTGFALWALRGILEPFVLAVFLLIIIDGLARLLTVRLPKALRRLALPVAIAAIVAVLVVTIWVTADNASDFAAQSASYTARINDLLGLVAQHLGLRVTPTLSSLIQTLNPAQYVGVVAGSFSHFAEATIFVLIYLGFLLASRRGFKAKAQGMFQNAERRVEAQRVFNQIRDGLQNYIWVQTVVGLIITAASAALMAAVGLSHIPFWCLIIFLTNYIPAIGAAVGVLFPAVFGLVEVQDIWRGVILLVGLEAIHFAVSHVVQPRMQGRSLNLDPIVVLLALAFWGFLWGVTGAFLSTPLAVMTMAILAEFSGTRPLAVLMSSDGKPYEDLAG